MVIFSTNFIFSTIDDGCTVDMEGEVVCAGPFPYFKIVSMVAIVGGGAAVEGVTTLCLRRKDARMQRRVSIHSVDRAVGARASGGGERDLGARLLG
jgi:hypothetical protein